MYEKRFINPLLLQPQKKCVKSGENYRVVGRRNLKTFFGNQFVITSISL
jgi:hypothetical protein